MSLPDANRDMKVKDDYDKLIRIIEDEPIFANSIFKEMGYYQGLKHIVWMMFHPVLSAKLAACGFRSAILRKLYITKSLS
jgi:hypothetical protein